MYEMFPSTTGCFHSVVSCTLIEWMPAMSLPAAVTMLAWPKLPGVMRTE